MFKSTIYQLSFVLMSLALFTSASSISQQQDLSENKQHELTNICNTFLAQLSKDANIIENSHFGKCASYFLARMMARIETINNNLSGEILNEEDNDEEEPTGFYKQREARRIKQFWKRRAGNLKGLKKFW